MADCSCAASPGPAAQPEQSRAADDEALGVLLIAAPPPHTPPHTTTHVPTGVPLACDPPNRIVDVGSQLIIWDAGHAGCNTDGNCGELAVRRRRRQWQLASARWGGLPHNSARRLRCWHLPARAAKSQATRLANVLQCPPTWARGGAAPCGTGGTGGTPFMGHRAGAALVV